MSDAFLVGFVLAVVFLLFGCGGDSNTQPAEINVPAPVVTVYPPAVTIQPEVITVQPALGHGKHGHHH